MLVCAQISVVWSVYTLEDPIEAAKCQITMFLPTDFLLNLDYLIGVTVNEQQTCEEEKLAFSVLIDRLDSRAVFFLAHVPLVFF